MNRSDLILPSIARALEGRGKGASRSGNPASDEAILILRNERVVSLDERAIALLGGERVEDFQGRAITEFLPSLRAFFLDGVGPGHLWNAGDSAQSRLRTLHGDESVVEVLSICSSIYRKSVSRVVLRGRLERHRGDDESQTTRIVSAHRQEAASC